MRAANTPGAGRTGHVVVIGGGIAGLAAAHRLLDGGARVTVLEASGRLGGKLCSGEIEGVPVDLGAESMLARRPEAVELARAVGLGDRLQPPATATASLWTRGGLRPMPKGHVMGVPGDLEPLAASGVISEEGLARIARDRELPPTPVGEDVALGGYLAERLGREVVDRLVEPLLGGVYAGDVYRTSMRASVPTLFEVAQSGRPLTEGVRELAERSARRQDGPVFMGIDGGIGRLPLAVADAVRAAGGEIRTGAPVRELRRTADGWTVVVDGAGGAGGTGGTGGAKGTDGTNGVDGADGPPVVAADAVVLAVPAPAAARLLAAGAPAASAELATVDYASMALITMAFRRTDMVSLAEGSGFLVPPVDGRTIKAATFSSRKWGWLRDAGPDLFVLRTSIGRFDDEADLKRDDADLVRMSLGDLGEAVGLAAKPVASRVDRWDGGLPQYPVGHLDRVARIRAEVAKVPGLAVCGALYDGVGIPACVGSARKAADELLGALAGPLEPGAGAGERE
ncbi:protoporphyrinogen oxidase [Streptomyces rapamycinicus]|uniref:Coproporphyrinogen III oxidase n=2 Tax=Streptomyces rapamycinicus TaxID=1226757 RepID=A0A0A0NBV1_STRRN|nr:protoporphyrinogen oxidase [Streptomyces rapamycinicus]AGP54444.1 protoporphyrinogen oxidase [Streptomyces rapamycinicus NRRL 5491]MBB4781950.1 oxygen-dependent protoporphyrinogen oxidase [Streptomyces rapamycinicus]RLV73408.1 protoporphyrinogen oxidase [Streptomyces rapamycinicus NRRL 5491]UTO62499.1 protoporphyrinogen oxidase [Streptomyces rapamycinicus]UTP30455.1 protoporphyrinogen oxidase [Streptomyces rapamycinicus NRRL 5491]